MDGHIFSPSFRQAFRIESDFLPAFQIQIWRRTSPLSFNTHDEELPDARLGLLHLPGAVSVGFAFFQQTSEFQPVFRNEGVAFGMNGLFESLCRRHARY